MEKKTKVAILDLRGHEGWNEDFCLVRHSLEYSKSMDDALYFDEKGFLVFQDAPKWTAEAFYHRYCEEHNLKLVPYDKLDRYDPVEKAYHILNDVLSKASTSNNDIQLVRSCINAMEEARGFLGEALDE